METLLTVLTAGGLVMANRRPTATGGNGGRGEKRSRDDTDPDETRAAAARAAQFVRVPALATDRKVPSIGIEGVSGMRTLGVPVHAHGSEEGAHVTAVGAWRALTTDLGALVRALHVADMYGEGTHEIVAAIARVFDAAASDRIRLLEPGGALAGLRDVAFELKMQFARVSSTLPLEAIKDSGRVLALIGVTPPPDPSLPNAASFLRKISEGQQEIACVAARYRDYLVSGCACGLTFVWQSSPGADTVTPRVIFTFMGLYIGPIWTSEGGSLPKACPKQTWNMAHAGVGQGVFTAGRPQATKARLPLAVSENRDIARLVEGASSKKTTRFHDRSWWTRIAGLDCVAAIMRRAATYVEDNTIGPSTEARCMRAAVELAEHEEGGQISRVLSDSEIGEILDFVDAVAFLKHFATDDMETELRGDPPVGYRARVSDPPFHQTRDRCLQRDPSGALWSGFTGVVRWLATSIDAVTNTFSFDGFGDDQLAYHLPLHCEDIFRDGLAKFLEIAREVAPPSEAVRGTIGSYWDTIARILFVKIRVTEDAGFDPDVDFEPGRLEAPVDPDARIEP